MEEDGMFQRVYCMFQRLYCMFQRLYYFKLKIVVTLATAEVSAWALAKADQYVISTLSILEG